jgi:hypothetical protein
VDMALNKQRRMNGTHIFTLADRGWISQVECFKKTNHFMHSYKLGKDFSCLGLRGLMLGPWELSLHRRSNTDFQSQRDQTEDICDVILAAINHTAGRMGHAGRFVGTQNQTNQCQ